MRHLLVYARETTGAVLAAMFLTVTPSPAAADAPAAIRWVYGALPEALSLDSPYEQVRRNPDMTIAVPRMTARPGQRWLELLVASHPRPTRAEWADMRVKIYPIDGPEKTEPVASWSQSPPPGWAVDQPAGQALLQVDLRRLGLERARLRVEMWQQPSRRGNREHTFIAAEEFLVGAAGPAMTWTPEQRVPIHIDVPEGSQAPAAIPITFGMPLPAGAIWDAAAVRLVDSAGNPIASQREITARWAEEGSAKWIRFDAVVPGAEGVFVQPVRVAEDPAPQPALQVEEDGFGRIILDTGASRFVLGAGRSPIHRIEQGGRQVAVAGPRGLYVVDQAGRVATASSQTVLRIEARGPVTASVRFEGHYLTEDGEAVARHITRVEAFAGQPEARVTHTFILTRNTNHLWFKEIGWEFDVAAGADPRGLFSLDRLDWDRVASIPLDGHTAAHLFQKDHVQFRGGENQSVLGVQTADGQDRELQRGATIGDWAALVGAEGGLAIACREAARQHPKEMLVQPGRITLKLFSNRAGEELDFRPAALAARWNRGGMLVEGRHARVARRGESLAPVVKRTPTDATGWARTHQLAIVPVAGDDAIPQAVHTARINRNPIYALADPHWLYQTQVYGPLYPRDRDRFPEAEAFIEHQFEEYYARGAERDGEFGFIDYFAGPHYREMGIYRYTTTYAVRPSAWLLYARSGERRIRQWIAASTRTYTDGVMAHWDDTEDPAFRRIAGLYTSRGPTIMMMAPYYWGEQATPYHGDGQASNSILAMQYHLTGYRRAADVMDLYSQGLKRWWTPRRSPGTYPSRLLRNIHNAYTFNWDPELRIILEDYIGWWYDPQGEVSLNPGLMKGNTTRKSPEHTSIPVKIYEALGDQRFRDIAMGWARANLYGQTYGPSRLGVDPLGGRAERGRIGHFYYQQTGRRHLLEEMLLAIHQSVPGRTSNISSINWNIQGIVYGMALAAEHDVDRQSVAAWVAYDDSAADGRVRIFARKGVHDTLRFRTLGVLRVASKRNPHPFYVGGRPHQVSDLSIPKDNDPGTYELLTDGDRRGYRYVFSDTRDPLVIHADGPWQPAPLQMVNWPAIYFQVPDDAHSPRIHFDGSARLIDPDGEAFNHGELVSGQVDLPRPGMWGFIPVENRPVRVENIPPVFAFRDPAYHFIPDPQVLAADHLSDSGDDEDDD